MTWLSSALLALVLTLVTPPWAAPAASEDGGRTVLQAYAAMTLEQKVGQLLMVGTPADHADQQTRDLVRNQHLGNIMLTGRSTSSRGKTARVVTAFERLVTADATAGIGMFVATDQEGGNVQVLKGRGFSRIPTAAEQGRLGPSKLRARSRMWGRQLALARVNMNLGPVLDTVPKRNIAKNEPIGQSRRYFGMTPSRVSSRGVAVVQGYSDAGVVPAIKHFPGLGRVRANTDTAHRVKDGVTAPGDPFLQPFADAIAAGAPVVMMSLATYTRLDPRQPAALSPAIVTGLLRGSMGFQGVVMSDSFDALAVRRIKPGQRAVRFIDAGGDIVLLNSPGDAPKMYAALLARAQADPVFAAKVDAAVLRVLQLKDRSGLLH